MYYSSLQTQWKLPRPCALSLLPLDLFHKAERGLGALTSGQGKGENSIKTAEEPTLRTKVSPEVASLRELLFLVTAKIAVLLV